MTAYIRYYRDQSRLPRAQVAPGHAALSHYLENDIQDPATAAEVMAILQKPASDEQKIYGNSYAVILRSNRVTLECLFDDKQEPYTLPLSEFQFLLAAWINFLKSDKLLSFVPNF